MRFNADFHVHSKYSRATSRSCDLENLSLWGRRKGLTVVGTGDFTHPAWLAELHEKLEPAEEGLYTLKADHARIPEGEFLPPRSEAVRFCLTVEISSIYKKGGKVRKVHNVLFAPDLERASKIAERLGAIGNVRSDGRPILGLDSRGLLEITLDCSPRAWLLPAHIWTPHFSALGARSGFDSIDDCYGDLAGEIFAVETGLSSDPPMNWRLSQLDRLTLVSNSDAHSPAKLAREANMFNCALSFSAIRHALEHPDEGGFGGTIEFFPEEGKYHWDGHRNCAQRMSPAETLAADGLCAHCGRKVTRGVLHRVEELADRPEGIARPAGRAGHVNLIPLQEILGEIFHVGPGTKTVMREYTKLIREVGSEIEILKDLPLDALAGLSHPLLPEAIDRMRRGDVEALAGYDGKFGTVSIFGNERKPLDSAIQETLF